ncbi:hypothetical protein E3P92_01682 [Wallemia ichthyophaga]|uniref:glutathione peroxidase n=2 Tax=Wallemia ichthyophaga TaxID=245174 RepID=A0A4V4MDG8_WALIC|nr:Glutaredoxin-1 [Wallemia ichthyophaga EXF-994]TIA73412.1 hypothetical protein E3P91_01522 [Wallemia ichthyophaga]EOR00216.1 Glutaredoxin-1 [Wallemia ichthyophaga EXF-994]TIA81475.1 hypothetical protein E3P98_02052 [Wallemia ichthyophaga]TIA91652.1 hypothetical protein E3P97_01826 [Wallemia ichthyophaga]TIA96252.1 hypothetical protein E3P95_03359 [Wallemia ichthyophaga]
MSAIAQLVEKTIAENVIAVFSKAYCPFCTRTKSLISTLPVKKEDVAILELDQMSNGSDIQDYLHKKTNQRSVPNVFVKQQHIGGNDDFHAAHSAGKIQKLLE